MFGRREYSDEEKQRIEAACEKARREVEEQRKVEEKRLREIEEMKRGSQP